MLGLLFFRCIRVRLAESCLDSTPQILFCVGSASSTSTTASATASATATATAAATATAEWDGLDRKSCGCGCCRSGLGLCTSHGVGCKDLWGGCNVLPFVGGIFRVS